jgi:hypothetical protein
MQLILFRYLFEKLFLGRLDNEVKKETINFKKLVSTHPQCNHKNGWKNVLNNLRLIFQPTLLL